MKDLVATQRVKFFPQCQYMGDGKFVSLLDNSKEYKVEIKSKLVELMNTVSKVQPTSGILAYNITPHLLTQFILDCTSPNLPDAIRIPMHNPDLPEIYRISRDWCFAMHSERLRLLRLSHK